MKSRSLWKRVDVIVRRHSTKVSYSNVIQDRSNLKAKYDAVIIGAGHNGLIAAAYLARRGMNVGVFEKRNVIGGAAVTEEIIPGYKFSRASYVLSLLRPLIIKELDLAKHGLKIFDRTVSAFTPLLPGSVNSSLPSSLCLFPDDQRNYQEISKFSKADAQAFPLYEKYILDMANAVDPLLDNPTPVFKEGVLKAIRTGSPLIKTMKNLDDIADFYDFVTSPITKTLDKWFETDVLKATLATDGVIGAMMSPKTPGSSYVLLHHMLGEVNGEKGTWGFVEGGMGAVSSAIAKSAVEHGAEIFVNQSVKQITSSSSATQFGIVFEDGSEVEATAVLSNATPEVTFKSIFKDSFDELPQQYRTQISSIDYTSPVTKINIAVDRVPRFLALGNDTSDVPNELKGTIHLNCESVECVHDAYLDAELGRFSKRPMIEMCMPSSVDPTLAPSGHHVLSLFTQYTPYYLGGNREWTDQDKDEYRDAVFRSIEDYAPGFTNSVVGYDLLTPMDLDRIFSLTGGNIFHGAISLDQLFLSRPTPYMASQRTPMPGLYLCGSGTHPGGGVMGSCGRFAALALLEDRKKLGI